MTFTRKMAASLCALGLALPAGCDAKKSDKGGSAPVGGSNAAIVPATPATPPVVELKPGEKHMPAPVETAAAKPAETKSTDAKPTAKKTEPAVVPSVTKESQSKPVTQIALAPGVVIGTTASGPKTSATKTAEAKPVAAKPAETKPAAAQPRVEAAAKVESKPETKPAESKKQPVQVALADAKPAAVAAAASGFADESTGFIPPQAASAGKQSVPAKVYGVKKDDWNQWGGSSVRNNVPEGKNIPSEWDLGDSYRDEGVFKKEEASKNVLWAAAVGSQTYGNPVVANGKVYVGTNNGAGWLKRYPANVDLGCLIAFDEKDGKFLWQHSSEKLPTGRVHDWPMQGICAAPLVEGDKLWVVTSRGLVVCVDTEGFHDGEDDGPIVGELARLFDVMQNEDPKLDKLAGVLAELKEGKVPELLRKNSIAAGLELPAEIKVTPGKRPNTFTLACETGGKPRTLELKMEGPKLAVYKVLNTTDLDEADVIWQLDMMNELGVSQHNMCSCSLTDAGDILFVCTSNGVDEGHINLPAPNAPSFLGVDKKTGKVLWKDSSPGLNILHGQWSSPAYAVIDGVPQVIFAGGDGWLYSFRGDGGHDGKAELLWKFDANPKESKYILGGRGTRNEIIATPVIYNDLVYLAVGQDPEHGEGIGHLWCIDPKKRGDISGELAFNLKDAAKPIPHRRLQAVIAEEGEVARPNPNSGVVWHYSEYDADGNKKFAWEEQMHRTCGTVVIKDDLLYIADFSGLFHCVDAKTGIPYWTHDLLAACWGSAMVVDGKVYVGDEEGKVCVFKHSKEYEEPIVNEMGNSVYTTPVVANNKLFISNKTHVFAIGEAK